MKKAQQTIWIIIGAIIAIISLIIVLMVFSGNIGKNNRKLKTIQNDEIGALTGNNCKSIVMDRACFKGNECPTGYSLVSGKFDDCDEKEYVCCEKISDGQTN